MNLFIDTLSSQAALLLFSDKKQIIDDLFWDIKWNESKTLIPKIDDFLKRNDMSYFDIENIVVVNGPGSFTWIRTTVLVANTINYIIKKKLFPISFFDLFHDYPIVKSSSKRDCFVQLSPDSKIEIIKNDELQGLFVSKNISKIYGEVHSGVFESVKIIDKVDYKSIIASLNLESCNGCQRIDALYLKKPNIS